MSHETINFPGDFPARSTRLFHKTTSAIVVFVRTMRLLEAKTYDTLLKCHSGTLCIDGSQIFSNPMNLPYQFRVQTISSCREISAGCVLLRREL